MNLKNEEKVMVTCITYGDKLYKKAAEFNLTTAKDHGADKTILYTPNDIEFGYKLRNWRVYYGRYRKGHFKRRGAGYWMWKPYIIKKALETLSANDILVYSDAGSAYVNDIEPLINTFKNDDLYFMLFSLTTREKKYSKRDALILLDADSEEFYESRQRMGGFLVMKKCSETYELLDEWQKACEDYRIITDKKSTLAKEHEGFKDNRHDQTALSLITKKRNIVAYRDPSQYGIHDDDWPEDIKERSNYPQIWYSTRNPEIYTYEALSKLF